MRKVIYRGTEAEGRALLARAPAVGVAMVSDDGAPILKTFNAVVDGDVIAFHGAPAGEKMEGLERPVVVGAHETVASIPSWFLDPERACPATTYYLSVQAHGVAREVADPARKARLLAALMAKHQPEGRHVPLDAEHPLYRKVIAGLLVVEVPLDRVSCKVKLGQNRPPAQRLRVLEHLWRRGEPGDVRAIAIVRAHAPELPCPGFLAVPERARGHVASMHAWLDDDELDEAVGLLEGQYWLVGISRDELRVSLAASTAVAAARDAAGRLVGFARAVSDGRRAWIYDVVTAPHVRGGGVGTAIMGLLLDHPAVRCARSVRLATRDAMPFYARLGFRELDAAPRHAWRSTEMIRSPEAVRT